ncbi:MAG: hypothetical protein KC910_17840 [Candidatus Eremiobacteraeota bacterium]|nr:hypothetical protein [Candidatus Eremiobacteraeota bacterium]
MIQMTHEKLELSQWMDSAFHGAVPAPVSELLETRNTRVAVLEEMMTQMEPEMRKAVECLHEAQVAETALQYQVLQSVFERHLANHP